MAIDVKFLPLHKGIAMGLHQETKNSANAGPRSNYAKGGAVSRPGKKAPAFTKKPSKANC